MNCQEINSQFSQYVDDALSLPARVAVDQHLDRCPLCRAELAELRALTRSFRQLARPLPPPDLASSITDALTIEAAAKRQSQRSFSDRLAIWLEPRLMPYGVGAFASVLLFVSMFVALRPHFEALQQAARRNETVLAIQSAPVYDINQPVSPADLSARRAPFAEQSPSLDPSGALAALTSAYATPHANAYEDDDDMIVVADVFSNGSASLADVVQAPKNRRMLAEFDLALRQSAAFVPASLDRRPGSMRVVFSVHKVDVRDTSF